MDKKEKKNGSIDRNIRQCMSYCIKNNGPLRWSKVLGFSKEEFLAHIEEEFTDGMSFENYGQWCVSFRIPKKCFKFNSIRDEDFKRCWSLKNITPKWLIDAQHAKKQISRKMLDEYGLYDILPTGNIADMLVD